MKIRCGGTSEPVLRSFMRRKNPQSLNRFAYGRNNPFRFVDPTGMFHSDLESLEERGDLYDSMHEDDGDGSNGSEDLPSIEQLSAGLEKLLPTEVYDLITPEKMREILETLQKHGTVNITFNAMVVEARWGSGRELWHS